VKAWLTLDSAEKIFKIAAIIIGGIWVYYNYFRGRTYKPRLEPTISGKIIKVGGIPYLVIKAKLKNAGLSKIGIKQEGSAIRILAYDLKKQANSVELVGSNWLATFSVFEEDEWVEPGKGIEDQLLITIPEHKFALFRVELRVLSGGIECQSIAVVENSFEKEKSDEPENLRSKTERWRENRENREREKDNT
jgi:hypothetical protein